ncbi:uncharacterized protein LOC127729231 [Mytilus californianus]|uniref:uncharacterized protein LOC127729231 n=1 Tax=Mytilus californianus TaxID=6549 RepID=UPI0022481FF2|nr:uncharacterized protein LOC127729231 [Mytilus californianus]
MAGEGRYLLGSTDNILREQSTGAINKAADDSIELGPRTIKDDPSMEGTSYHRIKTAVGCCACTKTNRNKLWFQIILFSLVLLFDVADVFSDWSLFCDVIKIKRGLVFGPPETRIIYALLCFSVLGTITFSVEIVNVWLEIFYHQPIIDPELASLCTIWIEDVPQIFINIFIALCREYAISYYQVVKAVVIILGSLARVLMALVRFVDRQQDDETEDKPPKTGLRHLTYRVLIILGLLLLFFSSITLCFLTLFEHTPNGYIKFGTPKGLYHGKYDSEKFFNNVSIYLNLPILEFDNTTDNSNINWIRLTSIYDIKERNSDTVKLSYDSSTKTKFVLWHSGLTNQSILEARECFHFNSKNKTLLKGPNDCENFLRKESTNSVIIQFILIPEKIPQLAFGDIHYNIRFRDQDGCHNMTIQAVSDISHRINGGYYHPVIHYYRSYFNVSGTNHLVWESATNPRFYHQKTDLIDITSVWKTGFAFCESTGSLAPHKDSSIGVNCI